MWRPVTSVSLRGQYCVKYSSTSSVIAYMMCQSTSLQTIENQEDWLLYQMTVLLFREAICRNGVPWISRNSTNGNAKSCTWGGITSPTSAAYCWPSGKQLCREGPRAPGGPLASNAVLQQRRKTASLWVHQEQHCITCRLRVWSFAFPQHWENYNCSAGSSSGLPGMRKTWTYWIESSKGSQRCWNIWSMWVMWREWESQDCSV